MSRIHVELWQRVKRNFGLRVLALAIAAGLWVFVNAAQHETEIGLTVPVQYTGLSPELVIINDHPQFVNLQISGPQTLLSLLDAGRMTVHLDLRGVTPGEADFKITSNMFHIPRQTSIDRISPAQITLDIDQIVTKDLPVHLDTTGQVANGLQIASVEIQPPVVSVTGPSRFLRNMGSVDTMPVDVENLSADVSREVPLADTGSLIKLPVARVVANIHLGQVIVEREFHNIPIAVRNASQKSLVLPHTVSVAVRGPERSFDQLALNNSVYVDAQDLGSGWYEAPVMVDLPKGMEVVRETPQKVKLRLFRK
jgi:YbbR domain-containing protein